MGKFFVSISYVEKVGAHHPEVEFAQGIMPIEVEQEGKPRKY
jgi:hypothetical protein